MIFPHEDSPSIWWFSTAPEIQTEFESLGQPEWAPRLTFYNFKPLLKTSQTNFKNIALRFFWPTSIFAFFHNFCFLKKCWKYVKIAEFHQISIVSTFCLRTVWTRQRYEEVCILHEIFENAHYLSELLNQFSDFHIWR